jgi:hypothetical protein
LPRSYRIEQQIGKTQAILAPFPQEHTPWKCPWCLLASPTGGPPRARRWRRPQRPAAVRRIGVQPGVTRHGTVWTGGPDEGGWSVRGCFASGPRHGPAGKAGGTGGDDFKRHFTFTGAKGRDTLPQRVRHLLFHAGVGLVERKYLLATTGWGNGRRNRGQLEVT